ncbi:hypothetical protein DT075_34595 [Bacillus licheniformis]|nr:hypothetical protein DT075_34595 [Bacillus licheniformis]
MAEIRELFGDSSEGNRLFSMIQKGADISDTSKISILQPLNQEEGMSLTAAMSDDEIVCGCNGVSKGMIIQAIVCGVETAPYEGSVLSTQLKVSGVEVFSAGDFNEDDGEDKKALKVFDEQDGIYKKIVLRGNQVIGAVLAVGIKPNVQLGKDCGLPVNRGIVVNDYMETEVPNIYAVGECAEHRGIAYGLVAPLYEQAKVLAKKFTVVHLAPYLMERQLDAAAGRLLQKELEKQGMKFLLEKQTEEIYGETRVEGLKFKDGSTLEADLVVLILATGSLPFILPLPGADKEGVTAFRDIKDTDIMLEASKTYKKAAVIGGGLLGLEAARGLLNLGMDAHPNYNRILLSKVLQGDTDVKDITLNDWDWYEENGIQLYTGEEVVKVDPESKTVITDTGRVQPYDEVICDSFKDVNRILV